ncbi:MAG: hypothetical protein H7245_01475 [Candidatus Saccharibacteria bacterium]|nr:hypothetical protein [Pseudorhodobacter sp.]
MQPDAAAFDEAGLVGRKVARVSRIASALRRAFALFGDLGTDATAAMPDDKVKAEAGQNEDAEPNLPDEGEANARSGQKAKHRCRDERRTASRTSCDNQSRHPSGFDRSACGILFCLHGHLISSARARAVTVRHSAPVAGS